MKPLRFIVVLGIAGLLCRYPLILSADEATNRRTVTKNRDLVRNLKPEKVFEFFAEISAVPRNSGDPDAIADHLVRFAEKRGLEFRRGDGLFQDKSVPNVVIRKPGRNAISRRHVALQAHMDMVCTKNPASNHDFRTDPIGFVLEGNCLRADGTTLGADDGIGMAIAMAVLDAEDLVHPPLEVLFTVDEETDMKGALSIDPGDLKSERLINIDALDASTAIVAGVCGVTAVLDIPIARCPAAGSSYCEIDVTGLRGGHSGFMIHKQRANACILLARFLRRFIGQNQESGVATLNFQTDENAAKNAICDFARAKVIVSSEEDRRRLTEQAESWTRMLRAEYRISDPEIRVSVRHSLSSSSDVPMTPESRDRLFQTILSVPQGVFRISQDDLEASKTYDKTLVETSCNLGVLETEKDRVRLTLYARGAEESPLEDILDRLDGLTGLCGGRLNILGWTEAWKRVDPPSKIQKMFLDEGYELVGAHAGFECGCFVATFEKAGRTLEAVTVGPQIIGAHSPTETLLVDSVEPLWNKIRNVLEKLARMDE